ncbi:hypothetical protein Ahy_A01g001783 isoform B [Arachis hypogaea]|uniref:Thioredoxin domain-containing protein n=1 Tax=Arachis hypogaea TaxID=3818 RepID=A0A445EPG5_ARAHY|nr:hypothetical protein Ahy_A01g001783 isoform B [Arachis hypogaea]
MRTVCTRIRIMAPSSFFELGTKFSSKDMSLTGNLALRVLLQTSIKDGIRNLVTDLVRVTFIYRFGGEEKARLEKFSYSDAILVYEFEKKNLISQRHPKPSGHPQPQLTISQESQLHSHTLLAGSSASSPRRHTLPLSSLPLPSSWRFLSTSASSIPPIRSAAELLLTLSPVGASKLTRSLTQLTSHTLSSGSTVTGLASCLCRVALFLRRKLCSSVASSVPASVASSVHASITSSVLLAPLCSSWKLCPLSPVVCSATAQPAPTPSWKTVTNSVSASAVGQMEKGLSSITTTSSKEGLPLTPHSNFKTASTDDDLAHILFNIKSSKTSVTTPFHFLTISSLHLSAISNMTYAVINYGASWYEIMNDLVSWFFRCRVCSEILPAFHRLSNNFPKLSFVYVDIDECPETTQHIRYTPTFQFFRDGEKVDEMYGAGEERLRDRVSQATLLSGSCSKQASRMASETWSQILSG